MKGAKRVRFRDAESDRSQSGRSEAASAPCNSNVAPASHDPKTSEFAFFKRFREDVSLKHQSKLHPRGNIQLKRSKVNPGRGECSTTASHGGEVTDNKKIFSSSLSAENARPSKTDLWLSPQFMGLRRSDKSGMVKQGNKNPASSSFIRTKRRNDEEETPELSCLIKTPTSSGPDDFFMERATESVCSVTCYKDGDIFSKKRVKLQRLVVKTVSPMNDEILKGCDVISLLLNRLLLENFGSNHIEALKPRPDKRETEYQSVYIPKSDHQLKESRSERKLVKYEEPYYMDTGAFSSSTNKFHRPFLLEGPVGSACFPTFESADHVVLGHQETEIEPCYFSNSDYKQSRNRNSEESFEEENAKCYCSFVSYNPSRMSHEYEPVQGRFWNDDPSSSWYYRVDNTFSAPKRFLLNDESSTACVNNYDDKFLLEYEKREPEWITNNADASSSDSWLNSTFEDSPRKCRSSAQTTLMEFDQSNDDLGRFGAFRRKPTNLLLDWDVDRLNENETIHSFPSTAFMHYQQKSETTTDPDYFYSSSYLDDALQRFDTRKNYVFARSHPPFYAPRELIPAEDGFFIPPSHQCLIEEITPETSYPPNSIAHLPFPVYHPLQAPVISYSSPYLLLEGSNNIQRQSSGFPLLDWRDTDGEM